jgi:hypothetical protein
MNFYVYGKYTFWGLCVLSNFVMFIVISLGVRHILIRNSEETWAVHAGTYRTQAKPIITVQRESTLASDLKLILEVLEKGKEARPTIPVICCMIATAYCFIDALLGRTILLNVLTILVANGASWWLIRRYNRSNVRHRLAMAAFENWKDRMAYMVPPNSRTILYRNP